MWWVYVIVGVGALVLVGDGVEGAACVYQASGCALKRARQAVACSAASPAAVSTPAAQLLSRQGSTYFEPRITCDTAAFSGVTTAASSTTRVSGLPNAWAAASDASSSRSPTKRIQLENTMESTLTQYK